MAQLTTVLPSVGSKILAGAQGGVTRSTTVLPGYTGVEFRNKAWSSGRHAWTLTYKGLLSDVQPVLDLFEEAEGQHKSFRFAPPGYTEADFRFASDELKPTIEATPVPGDYIATVTINVIQVIGE